MTTESSGRRIAVELYDADGAISFFDGMRRIGAESWMTRSERRYLFALAASLEPGAVVAEIGTYIGATAALFAVVAEAYVFALDNWCNQTPVTLGPCAGLDQRAAFVRLMELLDVSARVWPVDGDSRLTGAEWRTPLDVLIVDGDHTVEGARADLDQFTPWVQPGGWLVVDDFWSIRGVRTATLAWEVAAGGAAFDRVWGFAPPPEDPMEQKMVVYRRRP